MVSKNFSQQELCCSCCGELKMTDTMINVLQGMRDLYARPLFVSSGYRCKLHPVESMKAIGGEHTFGMAVDIICHGALTLELIRHAQSLGVTRLGLNQKGRASSQFMHVGVGDKFVPQFHKNTIWTY